MKITTILLFACFLSVSATTMAQKITLKEKNASLGNVLNQIRRQSGYDVICRDELLNKSAPVTLTLNNATLDDALKASLQDQSLTYEIEDGTIIIKEKEVSLSDKAKAIFAQVTVIAKVFDEQGKPLLGVTVKEIGTENATLTDSQGHFSLTVANEKSVLSFSFIGFETQEYAANKIVNASIITLKASTTNLKEVVVNKGYYNTTSELNTGNVSSVSAKEIEEAPVSNVLSAIEGRVPGLLITQVTGMPGGSYTVQIRGQNSIANGSDPLYIVDGVPFDSTLLPNSFAGGGGNPLNYLNSMDIESIDVLKDADATAIYGSRGANGVVLITTKKGKSGDTKVNLNVYSGIAQVPHMVNYLNTAQYLQMRHEAFKNDGATPSLDNGDYDILQYDTTRYTDWQKKLIGGTAHYSDAQASISGGNTNTQYLIGGGYHRETTVFPADFADVKGSVHFSINSSSDNQKFKVQLTGSYVSDNDHLPQFDLTNEIHNLAPDAPSVYNADGTLNWAPNSSGGSTWVNPYASLLQKLVAQTNNLVANAILSYQIIPGLTLKSNVGYHNIQVRQTSTQPIASFDPSSDVLTGFAVFTNNSTKSWVIEPQLNYQTKFWKGDLNALLGGTFQEESNDGEILIGNGYTSDALIQSIGGAGQINVNNLINSIYKYSAIYGRLNYNVQDKYLLNLTARRDGTSRFGPSRQFANFWAIGTGWIFSKENFMKDALPVLSFGKLRASYGSTGNDQVGDYKFLDIYNATSYQYANTVGLTPANLFNPTLEWEINKKLEAGIELGFFEDRLYLTASYFSNRSSNQLVNAPLPSITGFSSIAENLPALVQNTGMEYTINSINIANGNLKWTSSFNLTIPRNKLLAFPDLATSYYAGQLVIGQPLSIQKVFRYDGVNPETGIYQFLDKNGNITTNPDYQTDRTALVNTDPKYYGGLQNNFEYKGISLSFLFQFVKRNGISVLYTSSQFPPGIAGYNQLSAVLTRWQDPGDKANIQKFTETYADAYNSYSNLQYSSKSYSDASFIRLKNVSISYNLPKSVIRNWHLETCRIYMQGENLFTFPSHYLGYDPETQYVTTLPPLRVITAGIQVGF